MHAICGNRFYNADWRNPAWHKLGITRQPDEPPLGAVETLKQKLGVIEVSMQPVFIKVQNSGYIEVPNFQCIVRHPIPEDPRFLPQGVVTPEYTLFQPIQVARVLDEHVGLPVETAAFLFDGTRLFFCYRLDDFDVKGDPCQNYMTFDSPMDGLHAASAVVSPVRVVCWNTLQLAQSMAAESFKVVHNRHALSNLAAWMQGIVERIQNKAQMVRKSFEVLADHRVTKDEWQAILKTTYPIPKEPDRSLPQEILDKRLERWELERTMVLRYRDAVTELFDGKGTGADHPAYRGTAWGAYNACTERANYGGGGKSDGVALSTLFGSRAQEMQRAFTACLAVARGEELLASVN